jgi:toluene monooxygenase system ferredoxin subunit
MTFQRVARADDLWSGETRGTIVGTTKVLLVNIDGVVRAYSDVCLHKGLELSKGRLVGCEIVCAAHEWRYDARTGCGINPRNVALKRYAVKIEDGDVLVDVDAEAP